MLKAGRYKIVGGTFKHHKILTVVDDRTTILSGVEHKFLDLTPKYYERIIFNDYISFCTNR